MALSVQDQVILERRIRVLVTPELMADARMAPAGPYSRDLIEVLDFVRRNPDPERPRYLIVELPNGFAVAVRNPEPSGAPRVIDGQRFATRDEAEHAVLVQRLTDYGVTW